MLPNYNIVYNTLKKLVTKNNDNSFFQMQQLNIIIKLQSFMHTLISTTQLDYCKCRCIHTDC